MTTEPPRAIRKTIELPLSEIEKAEGGMMRAIITAEIPDAEGDVVVVEGMAWERYSESNPLPVLTSHLRKLPDGRPPQVGYAPRLFKTKTLVNGQAVPAVVMEWAWVDTELAREWQAIAKVAGRLSFSIGATVTEAEPIENNGLVEGFRFNKTELTEVSVVTIPANPVALSIKEQTSEATEMTQEQLEQITKGFAELSQTLSDLASSLDAIETRIDEIATHQTVEANEADEPNETTKALPSDDLPDRLSEILNKVKSMKSTQGSTNGNQRDPTESHQRD